MSILEVHLLFVVIPLGLIAMIAALVYRSKGVHPETYKMSEKWTHEPILWAAVDERIGHGHGHESDELRVGGGASGKW